MWSNTEGNFLIWGPSQRKYANSEKGLARLNFVACHQEKVVIQTEFQFEIEIKVKFIFFHTSISFQPFHKGIYLVEHICRQLDIKEKDYFGLRYVDTGKQRV